MRGWWSGEIEGSTDQLGAEFSYRQQDVHYSKQRITELVPGQKVVCHILDAYLNFTEDPDISDAACVRSGQRPDGGLWTPIRRPR